MQKHKNGYLLWEAALGIILIGALYITSDIMTAELETERKAQLIGKDAADILHGIDKRIVLDSRVKATYNSTGIPTYGDWNAGWVGIDAVKTMMAHELVGFQNPECGVSALGWQPRFTANNTQALIPCELTQTNFTTLGFDIDSSRDSIPTNNEILGSWSITLYHSSPTLFEEYSRFYDEVIKGFKLNAVLKMAGQHRAYYVDRTTGNEISQLSKCIASSNSCGIRFEFRISDSIYDNEDGELRADRAIMMDDLTFRVSAASPEKCYIPTTTGATTVNCGMDFEVTNGKLDVNANKVTGDSFKLILEELNRNSPVSTECNDPSSPTATHHCGLSVIGGGAGAAKAYFDKVYAELLRFESLETKEFVVRKSTDKSKSTYNEGLRYSDSGINNIDASQQVTVSLDNGISFDATPSGLDILLNADEINITALGLDLVGQNVEVEVDSVGNVTQKTTSPQNINAKSTYFGDGGKNTALATQSSVLSNVKIVGIDTVDTGSYVRKKTCPLGSNGSRPSLKWSVIPASGFYTDLRHHKYDWGRCSPTGRNNGTGAKGIYLTTSGSTIYMRMNCDINRSMKVAYNSTSNSTSIYPKIYFDVIGRSGQNGVNYDEITGVAMNVIQYCDYTK